MDKGTEKTPQEIDEARKTWDDWLGDMSDRDQPRGGLLLFLHIPINLR